MDLNNVAQCARGKSFLRHLGRRFLAHEEYFGLGGCLTDSPGGVDSIQCWKPDVEEYQVGLQFFSFLDRL